MIRALIWLAIATLLHVLAGAPLHAQGDQCYYDANGNRICPQAIAPSLPANFEPNFQPTPARVEVIDPYDFEVSVEVQRADGDTDHGNGVVGSATMDGACIVVTNAHVVRGRANNAAVKVTGGDGQTYPGYVLAAEEATDLAVIRVDSAWRVARFATDVDLTGNVQIRGYHGGRFQKRWGPIARPHNYGYWVATPVPDGLSGSGVYQNGDLVGVVFGSDQRESSITSVGPIRRLLRRVLGHPRMGRDPATGQARFPGKPTESPMVPLPDIQPAGASPSPQQMQPRPSQGVGEGVATFQAEQSGCNCPEEWARFHAWQETVDEKLTRQSQLLDQQGDHIQTQYDKWNGLTLPEPVDEEKLETSLRGFVLEKLEERQPTIAAGVETAAKVYPWTKWIGPAGGAIAAAAGLWSMWIARRERRASTPAAGSGGPAAGGFR